jgi:hypothetical protein
MRSFGVFAAGLLILAFTSEASAQRTGSNSFSLYGSYFVINNVTGVVSVCFNQSSNATTNGGPTCSIAGTFPNVTSQTFVQTDVNSPVAWVVDRSSGRAMRCELTITFSPTRIPNAAGAACIMSALPAR